MTPKLTKKEIAQWLDAHNITEYKLKEDATHGCVVDVDGSVDLKSISLVNLPVQFGIVTGNFLCSDNQLVSLEGAPREVGGDFDCSYNQLKNLVGGPKKMTGHYFAPNEREMVELNNHIVALDEKATYLIVDKLATYRCSHNYIESLEGAPKIIHGHLDASHNLLENLLYCPKEIMGYINCANNYLNELKDFPKLIKNETRSSLVNNKNLHICQQSFNLAEVAALLEREKLSAQLEQNDKKMVIKI